LSRSASSRSARSLMPKVSSVPSARTVSTCRPPSPVSMQAGSAMLTSDLFANFIIGVVFLNALDALGGSLTCGIFLVLAMFSLILIYRLAPETKWHQLKSIRRYWYNGGRWPEKAETRARLRPLPLARLSSGES
jgi:hypothetical protein